MRRVRAEKIEVGEIELAKAEAHHARDVLRLGVGAVVEVFDAQGRSAVGKIARSDSKKVVVRVEELKAGGRGGFGWTVASAVPKGNRADWMIEKLAELGTWRFVPLKTARSVVVPEGRGKRERWERIAGEAAKQSRSAGVMEIGELRTVGEMVGELKELGAVEGRSAEADPTHVTTSRAWYLAPLKNARAMGEMIREIEVKAMAHLALLIGPEGGWTEEEMEMMDRAGLTGVRMGETILRVETAAVAAAAIVAGVVAPMAGESESA